MKLGDFNRIKKRLPDAPGVYVFRGKRRKILYIGRATSLRDRVRSYFSDDLIETRGPLLVDMVTKAVSVEGIPTDSVLEAIILEANLIKRYHPHANTREKDDKSYNYLVFTKEDFPRLVTIRGHELAHEDVRRYKRVFGPFPYGGAFKEALRIIRKLLPYRDTCTPLSGKPCFNAQIGLCPGVCAGWMSKAEYARTMRHLTLFFEGKKKALIRSLEREMRLRAKEEEFEKAEELRNTIFSLTHIRDVTLIKNELREPGGPRRFRIEGYDVAHISGTNTVGVMTVVEEGEVRKGDYRKFRIRGTKKGSDTDALKEVLTRRLGHDEWPMPKLIVVDGGKAQIGAAESVLAHYGIFIPVVGVVKDERHRPREILGDGQLHHRYSNEILLANAEAHRYAVAYHRRRRARL